MDAGEGDGVCDWARTGVEGLLWAGLLIGEPRVQDELGVCMGVGV